MNDGGEVVTFLVMCGLYRTPGHRHLQHPIRTGTKLFSSLGRYHFLRGGSPSICAELRQFFSGHPVDHGKTNYLTKEK